MKIKTHKKYLINKFIKKILIVTLIFFILLSIINILEEVSFLKNSNAKMYTSIILTLLNAPSILYQIFPFIFLISTQLFFIEIYQSKEFETLKTFNFTNFDLLKLISITTIFVGLFIVIIFYNFSSILKNEYLKIKNNFSTDDKYLAVITKNGLWIKDNLLNETIIVNSEKIDGNYLVNSSITKFDNNFRIYENIISNRIDISEKNWVIYNVILTDLNNFSKKFDTIYMKSNFDIERINNLFSDLTALTYFELNKLENDYNNIGYSTDEIRVKKHSLYSAPIFFLTMSIIGMIIMINYKFKKILLLNIFIGVLCSVLIYYLFNFFNILGINNKIPLIFSVWFPVLFLTSLSIIGIITFNEK